MAAAESRKKVFLHIGMPKTGTTTIQHFLAENATALAGARCLYPSTGLLYKAHHPVGAALLDRRLPWVDDLVPDRDDTLLQRLDKEIRRSKCSSVVISTEILSFVHDTDRAFDYFSRYDVRVVLFIRRQDHWMESLCRQEMKTGTYADVDPRRFIESRLCEADYLKCIGRWEKHLDDARIMVILLDRRVDPALLQQQFLSRCNIAWNQRYSINMNENIKLTQECLHFLLNCPDQDRIGPFYAHLNGALSEYSQENPEPPEYQWLLSPEQRREILESVHEHNVILARKYLRDEEARFFLDMDTDTRRPWQKYPGLSVRKAVEIGYSVFRKLRPDPDASPNATK